MVQKIDVHPEARLEIAGSLRYYEEKDPAVAEEFDAAIDAAVLLISAKPGTWPTHLHGTRRYLLHRFPFSIIYRERNDVI
jgi:plasmid stabilization system protein ParE